MTRRLFLTLVLGMALTAVAQAAWVPTGATDFVPPPTVQGKPGETVTLRVKLLYQVKDSNHPASKDWLPLPGAVVNFYVSGYGLSGQQACPQDSTGTRGVATSTWTMPNPTRATHYTYKVEYAGGRRDGVILKPRHENGRIDVVR